MRKLTKKIFALLGSFAIVAALVSCGDIATGDETQNLSETQGKARVIVNIESGLRSATLLPSDLTEDDITRVELSAIKVENDSTRSIDPSKGFERRWTSSESQTAIAQMKAATDIIVDIATYDFELSLYKSSEEGDSILCESAKLTQTMHLGNNTLNFAAKYVSDDTATGSLEVNFKFEKEDYVEHIGVEFYKEGDETSAQKENVYIYNKTNENDTFTAKYSMSGLEAGDYILKFYVYGLYPESRDADTSNLINTYQKLVRIAPFCKTFAEIELDNLNSIYIVKFVLPDGVESHMNEWRRSRNESYILPSKDDMKWPGHTFIGWYANEKFEGELVYYIEQGTKDDKTFYAKFEDGILISAGEISALSEKLAAANEAGLKSVTVKITDEITLDPLGENWMKDAIVYNEASGKWEYKYTSNAFAQITSVLEGFMNSSSTSDSEEYNGMKIELDLTETGISYLPTGAFLFTNLEPHEQRKMNECLGCLTAVKLPDTVTAILEGALQSTGITSFEVPANVTGIGICAFDSCNRLEVVDFAEGSKCTSIGESAFWGCSNLKSITIPAGVSEIGESAFGECENLTEINFAEGSKCTAIGKYAFYDCSNLKSITIPAGVTEIGNDAFYECSNLKSITIPAGVSEIGETAFSRCSGLETVNFAEGSKCTAIGSNAFYGCSNLKSITIPAGVTEIGESAFYECENLTEINFAEGSKCTTIGSYAFYICENLKSITIPAGVTEIGNDAFYECSNLKSITIPAGVTEIGETAFSRCSGLETVNFAEGSKCTAIGKNAFYGCENLKSITIPAGVTEIGEAAFAGCYNLEVVDFAEGSKCTTIGVGAFSKCSNLKSITIPAGVTKIGDWAFGGCGSLVTVSFAEGSKCTAIGEYAFYYCSNLKSITIPAGVTEIGNYAFDECENLTEINFAGSKEKWESIAKGENIFPSQVKEIKCTDGKVGYTYVEEDDRT